MSRRISPDNIENLLELASKPIVKKVKKQKEYPEIDKFITENNITSGKKRVPSSIVYYKYYLWKQTRLIPSRKFFNYFKTKFEKTKTDHGIGFLLNPKDFDLTPIGFFRARAFLRKQREEQDKKE